MLNALLSCKLKRLNRFTTLCPRCQALNWVYLWHRDEWEQRSSHTGVLPAALSTSCCLGICAYVFLLPRRSSHSNLIVCPSCSHHVDLSQLLPPQEVHCLWLSLLAPMGPFDGSSHFQSSVFARLPDCCSRQPGLVCLPPSQLLSEAPNLWVLLVLEPPFACESPSCPDTNG